MNRVMTGVFLSLCVVSQFVSASPTTEQYACMPGSVLAKDTQLQNLAFKVFEELEASGTEYGHIAYKLHNLIDWMALKGGRPPKNFKQKCLQFKKELALVPLEEDIQASIMQLIDKASRKRVGLSASAKWGIGLGSAAAFMALAAVAAHVRGKRFMEPPAPPVVALGVQPAQLVPPVQPVGDAQGNGAASGVVIGSSFSPDEQLRLKETFERALEEKESSPHSFLIMGRLLYDTLRDRVDRSVQARTDIVQVIKTTMLSWPQNKFELAANAAFFNLMEDSRITSSNAVLLAGILVRDFGCDVHKPIIASNVYETQFMTTLDRTVNVGDCLDTYLGLAIDFGNIEIIKFLTQQQGVIVDTELRNDMTFLERAVIAHHRCDDSVKERYQAIIAYLLGNHIDINQMSITGHEGKPLFLAWRSQNKVLMDFLIQKGARFNIPIDGGLSVDQLVNRGTNQDLKGLLLDIKEGCSTVRRAWMGTVRRVALSRKVVRNPDRPYTLGPVASADRHEEAVQEFLALLATRNQAHQHGLDAITND
ncbi:MAG: hypothetical protein WCJ17_00560 [bacterium]